MAKTNSFTKILAIIGAILIFIDGILGLLIALNSLVYSLDFQDGELTSLLDFGWLNAVIVLVIGILAMISVDLFKGGIPYNGIWLLVLGIAALVFGIVFLRWSIINHRSNLVVF